MDVGAGLFGVVGAIEACVAAADSFPASVLSNRGSEPPAATRSKNKPQPVQNLSLGSSLEPHSSQKWITFAILNPNSSKSTSDFT